MSYITVNMGSLPTPEDELKVIALGHELGVNAVYVRSAFSRAYDIDLTYDGDAELEKLPDVLVRHPKPSWQPLAGDQWTTRDGSHVEVHSRPHGREGFVCKISRSAGLQQTDSTYIVDEQGRYQRMDYSVPHPLDLKQHLHRPSKPATQGSVGAKYDFLD